MLEFDSFNSDLTCSRSQSTLVARILLEPRSPPSAQLSAHHFPQHPNPQSQLGTKEDSKTKLSLFPLCQVSFLFVCFYYGNFPTSTSREMTIINPVYPSPSLNNYQLMASLLSIIFTPPPG